MFFTIILPEAFILSYCFSQVSYPVFSSSVSSWGASTLGVVSGLAAGTSPWGSLGPGGLGISAPCAGTLSLWAGGVSAVAPPVAVGWGPS